MLITALQASFKATEAIPAGRRVKYVAGGGVALAGAGEVEIGISQLHNGKSSYASGDPVSVLLHRLPVLVEAAGAFADGATLQRMADGKVDDTGSGAQFAIALEASAAAADIVQVFPLAAPFSASVPADLSSTNLTGVDGAGSNAAPLAGTETRLDALEAKVNAILAILRNA